MPTPQHTLDERLLQALIDHVNGDKPLTPKQLAFIQPPEQRIRIRGLMTKNNWSIRLIVAVVVVVAFGFVTTMEKKEDEKRGDVVSEPRSHITVRPYYSNEELRQLMLEGREARDDENIRTTVGVVTSYRGKGNTDVYIDGKYVGTYWFGG